MAAAECREPMTPKPKHLKNSYISWGIAVVGVIQRRKELKGLGKHIPLGDTSRASEGSLGYVDHTVSVTRPKVQSPANSLLPLSLPSPDTSHTGLHSSPKHRDTYFSF